MSLTHDTREKLTMGVVLLAPAGHDAGPFRYRHSLTAYDDFLAGAQRLRGEIYLRDGAISPADLTDDGRYVQQVDGEGWHLLVVDDKEHVRGCIRYSVYPSDVRFSDLQAFHCSTFRSEPLGTRVRRAVQNHIDCARRLGFCYVEVGGWAMSEEVRCTTEVLKMVLMIYAFGRLKGGAYGLSTVTTRHHSSSILRRLGGVSLRDGGEELPAYHDVDYRCEMELLTFDSTKPSSRYSGWIDDCYHVLSNLRAIDRESEETHVGSLLQLDHALSGDVGRQLETEGWIAGAGSYLSGK